MGRKGISPLIATAILLVVTISVSIIVLSNFTSLFERTGDDVEEQNKKAVECTFAALAIDTAVVNTVTDKVTVGISNIGNNDVGLTHVSIYSTSGEKCIVWNATTLAKGDSDAKTISCALFSSCADVSHIRADTTCNGESVTVKESIECT